jgi:hypothetical protein
MRALRAEVRDLRKDFRVLQELLTWDGQMWNTYRNFFREKTWCELHILELLICEGLMWKSCMSSKDEMAWCVSHTGVLRMIRAIMWQSHMSFSHEMDRW